ncbi:hypothetical protein [Allocoleopsis franciscana]|uniref:Uncharacterized protein n=1 Tax=Allocoleopsis franciscana PCC 7113 TaxID=1173027 RepID=K9W6R0_9CYAN|nr:hypothetical protein [Allocoleopsis franciscana]AFZ16050.1 hypothetical protein Mic7113_0110 [Allocoleopsis franciscana PCC 7113]
MESHAPIDGEEFSSYAFEVLAISRLAQTPNPVKQFSGAVVCKRYNLREINLNSRDLSRAFLRSSGLTRAIL